MKVKSTGGLINKSIRFGLPYSGIWSIGNASYTMPLRYVSINVNGTNYNVTSNDAVFGNYGDYDLTVDFPLSVNVYMVGGAGGPARSVRLGGAGGLSYGTVNLVPGTTYRFVVAGGGGYGGWPGNNTIFCEGGYGGGGAGGDRNKSLSAATPYGAGAPAPPASSDGTFNYSATGGGGGCSALFRSTNKNNANAIMVAGGGAGGAYLGNTVIDPLANNGVCGGGGLLGQMGTLSSADGGAGTQSAGGAAGASANGFIATAGGAGYGGNGANKDVDYQQAGPGGGGGYYGGGGGGQTYATDISTRDSAGRAGGGSGYIAPDVINGMTVQANNGTAPFSPRIPSIYGINTALGVYGANGCVVFSVL